MHACMHVCVYSAPKTSIEVQQGKEASISHSPLEEMDSFVPLKHDKTERSESEESRVTRYILWWTTTEDDHITFISQQADTEQEDSIQHNIEWA